MWIVDIYLRISEIYAYLGILYFDVSFGPHVDIYLSISEMYACSGIQYFGVSIGPHVDIYAGTHLAVVNMMTHRIWSKCNRLSICFKLTMRQVCLEHL